MYILFEPQKAQTRRKHERYTQFCVFFVKTEDKIIGRKAALELAKHPQIHGVIAGNRFRIPKINVIRYMLCDADAS